MNLFIALGLAALIASEFHMPWRLQWRLMTKGLSGIYLAFRNGELPKRPTWSYGLSVLGFGLFLLGCWRALAGL